MPDESRHDPNPVDRARKLRMLARETIADLAVTGEALAESFDAAAAVQPGCHRQFERLAAMAREQARQAWNASRAPGGKPG